MPLRGGVRRSGAAAAAFAAAFVVTCALLGRVLSPPPVGGGKTEWFRDHGEAFDVAFVGSSRTARQLSPSVFDAEMAAAGRPLRSFNLGFPGMRPPEDTVVIERALSRRRAPLALLVVECNPVRLGIPPEDEGTARAVHWHDAARMAVLWRRAFARHVAEPGGRLDPGVVAGHLAELPAHARHFAWNAARLGRGADLLRDLLAAPALRSAGPRLGPRGDGYAPPPAGRSLAGAKAEAWARSVDEARRRRERRHLADFESQAELARKRALAERHGARLFLVAPPVSGRVFVPGPGVEDAFLDFADPDAYPELFAPEHRRDVGHLNAAGAELYSRLLAREIAARL